MPKKNNVGGKRPAKNYDPSYGKRPAKGGPKAGSRSPGHRGFRPEVEDAPRQKNRWDADDRAARSGARDDRAPRFNRDERPAAGRGDRDGRPARFDRDDRAPRRFDRDERPARFDRDDRAPRFNRDERPAAGRGDRDGRPARFDRDERAPRRFDRDDRAPRFNRDERPAAGRGDRDGRPARFDRDDRAPRFNRDERPARFDRDDRAPRRFDRDERPAAGRGDRDGRPARFDRDERAPRFNRDERPARFDRDDRAPRRFDRDERPAAGRGDRDGRPARFDRDERPARFNRDDRPARFERGDRPERPSHGDRGPRRGGYQPQDDVVLERLEAQAIQAEDVEGKTFGDLGLGGNIVNALAELGAAAPFPIQAATIPVVLEGRDVLGRGRTGSGKTIAFGAPLVERLMENGGGKNRRPGRLPRALILAPTRELALQIDRTVQPIARSVGLFTTQIYGGVPQHRQVGALQRGVDIVVGTPGRIEDLIEQGRLDLSEVSVVVLDEADHMCDLGFLEPVQRIIRNTADDSQKLLFSATLDKGVAALVNEFLENPAVHEVAGEDQASSTIDHRVLVVEHRDKDRILEQLAARNGKTLIFSRTRAYAERLTEQLEDAGVYAVALHGDLNQAKRTRNLQQLTSGRVDVLVATDVAARGIHVDEIDLVIQADAPDEYKTYTHRAGRTGRAGREGTVVTLIPRSRRRRMEELLSRAEISAEFVDAIPGDDIIDEIAGRVPTRAQLEAKTAE
ncbi:DEAD/DEAH box helicase [Mycetocola tolaasinivorans]|uniref:DEAD/DEAH box helicase n=1 Tax=Mycetocola tolaasinivorans TaxID=76635 RepID=A0A3L6ZZ33_9MICO|nr:DEAD/DEAH box helicase [Mycetocola tolaasinivorans]RLP73199.1 DEAD/DEAH box helicase [Mycetocola tolaasinivorans]